MTKFCIHSNVGISVVSTTGKLIPCCKYNAADDIKTIYDVDSLNELHATPAYQHIQSQLDAGIFPQGCNYCKTSEAAGIQSRRQHTNQIFAEPGFFVPGYVQDMEIALDYTCNMMCRMCNPGASSKWNTAHTVIDKFNTHSIELDTDNNYQSYQNRLKLVLDNTDLSHARHIKIEGGEPFYAKNLEWFLNKLDSEILDKHNFYLNIFTNGSIFPSANILEKLSKFNTAIVFSIDAAGNLASTIRWGIEWNTIAGNIRKWCDFVDSKTTMSLRTNITVSLLNVNQLLPLIDFCKDVGLETNFSELTSPGYLSIYQLPKDIRQQWTYDNEQLNSLIMADVAIEQEYTKFIASVNILDAYQGHSFETVNSEMYQLIQSLFPCCEA